MTQLIIDALVAKYNAQIAEGRANLQNYFSNPAGIGEHPNIVEECDKLISQIGSAQDKLQTLEKIVKEGNESSTNR